MIRSCCSSFCRICFLSTWNRENIHQSTEVASLSCCILGSLAVVSSVPVVPVLSFLKALQQNRQTEYGVELCCCWRGGRGIRSEIIPWRTCLLPLTPYERVEETSRWYQLNSCSSDGLLTPLLQKQTVPVCLETLPLGNNTTMAWEPTVLTCQGYSRHHPAVSRGWLAMTGMAA